ncbi:MAG TPA: glycosyltransferase, partial [Candidatus Krumholzibacterium sp.]|nr:glycosyltransferase [Candidatus Krumholzibacterium sp.]
LARRASKIIAVSDHARSSYLSAFPSLEGRFVTIHNGIRTERFESLPDRESCRKWFGFPEKAFIVGTVGRLVGIKNHRLLLDAFIRIRENVPDAHLAILGDGPLEMDLKRHAAESGAGRNVSIIPGSPEVPRFLGALDVFTLTSDSEGLPLTLLEACASSLPVVATSVGGIPEVIEHGVSGLLVGRGDRDALVDEISALALDPRAGTALGAAAKRAVVAGFTAGICASRTSSLYGQVLGLD